MSQLSYEQVAEQLIQQQRVSSDLSVETVANDLKAMAKKLSQLVAKSWLPEGQEIRTVLLSEDEEQILQLLRDNIDGFEEEFGNIEIEIVLNMFIGSLAETGKEDPFFKLNLAYPPKPTDFNVSDSELEEWVNNTNPQENTPPNPYIPVTW